MNEIGRTAAEALVRVETVPPAQGETMMGVPFEARDLVRRAGLTIGPELALAVRPGDDPGARDVPVNYACVARRVPA